MINRSLVFKYWLSFVTLVIVVLFFLGIFLSQFFQDFYFSLKISELRDNGLKIANMISAEPDMDLLQYQLTMISSFIEAKVVVTDRTGLIKACNMKGAGFLRGAKLNYPDVEKILKGQIIAQRGTYPGISFTVLSVGVPIKVGDTVSGAVFLNTPVEPVTNTIKTVQHYIIYGALGAIALATILAFFMSKSIVKPILSMNDAAIEMAKGNFGQKIQARSEDEIGMLGRTLNYLSSELEKNIDALSTEKDQLENILTSMTDVVITVNSNAEIILLNPQAEKLLEQIKKLGIHCFFDIPELKSNVTDVIQKNAPARGEVSVGEQIFTFGMNPLRLSAGDIRGVVIVLHDFTKEKRLELLRREFVANVSHELRSPLSLLQGYVEALVDNVAENEEERQRYLSILLDETLRLRRLVNDLLDLTQLETGNMKIRLEAVSVKDLVGKVTTRFGHIFTEQNKILKVNVPENLPFVSGNDDKLQQVLVNLLDNAMKYTPSNGIVEVGAVNHGNTVEVYISDTGPGISDDNLENVWERFYKVDKARTREAIGGTGLGLAIVKNIIQNLGGDVGVTSKVGLGSRFYFILKAV